MDDYFLKMISMVEMTYVLFYHFFLDWVTDSLVTVA